MNQGELRNPETIKPQFFDAYFRSMNLQQLVSALAELMCNPLIVYDTGFRILAHSDFRHITDPYWAEFVTQGYCSYAYACIIIGTLQNSPATGRKIK